jgi:hypothetical protein
MSHALTTGGGNGLGISSGNLIRWIKVMRTRRLAEQGRFMRAVHWTTVALPSNESVP